MNESRLISFENASRLLGGLHSNTLRQRKGGTENLTRVYGFGRRVMLIREEVEALVDYQIAQVWQRNGIAGNCCASQDNHFRNAAMIKQVYSRRLK